MVTVSMPAARARSSPGAPARFETTTAISASSVPCATASMSACRLLPRPEISTAIRRPGSDPNPGLLATDRGLTPIVLCDCGSGAGNPFACRQDIMARSKRVTPGGFVYHVFNRGSRKGVLFDSSEDYDAFVELMEEARRKRPMRIIAYSLMKTHVHFMLWPRADNELPSFMQWLTGNHARAFHRCRGTTGLGAVYQSRYKARPDF